MAMPTYGVAGTGASTTSSSSIGVPYPASVGAGDLLILHAFNRTYSGSISTPSGWTQIGSGVDDINYGEYRAYWKIAAGTESGSLFVATSSGDAKGSYARMYRFDGTFSGTPVEAVATGTFLINPTFDDVGVTTTGTDRVAVNLTAIKANVSTGSFTGETGGTWVNQTTYGTNVGDGGATLQIHTANMAAAGTINGGSAGMNPPTPPGENTGTTIGFAILSVNVATIGVATETDVALPIAGYLTPAGLKAFLGVATEPDTALAMTAVLTLPADTGLFAGIRFNLNSGGGYIDLTSRVAGANIRRGRPFNLDRIEAGVASARFNNGDGYLDPANPGGPYYGTILPLRPLWLYRVDGGVTYQRFQGNIERYQPHWAQPEYQFMNVEASDAFETLANTIIEADTAYLTTALTGANNDLTFTAVEGGTTGDNITVTYTVAGISTSLATGTNSPFTGTGRIEGRLRLTHLGVLGSMFGQPRQNTVAIVPVSVQGTDITVTVATDGGGNPTSTASAIKAALDLDAAALKLVTVALAPGSSGAGVVTAMAKTALAGGRWPEELAGARINRVLDSIGWSADLRNIDAGAYLMSEKGFALADNVSALSHIQDIAESDNGYVFVDGSGTIVFHDGNHRTTDTRSTVSQATFADDGNGVPYYGLEISFDKERIANDVTVTAGVEGALPQSAEDAPSQAIYGRRALSRVTQLSGDADALETAETLLAAYKDPLYRFDSITLLDLGTGDLGPYGSGTYGSGSYGDGGWAATVLGLEIGDLITVRTTPPVVDTTTPYTIAYDCHVEEITDLVEPGLPWRTTLKLHYN